MHLFNGVLDTVVSSKEIAVLDDFLCLSVLSAFSKAFSYRTSVRTLLAEKIMKKRSAKTLFAQQVQEVVSFIQPGLDSCYVETGGRECSSHLLQREGPGLAWPRPCLQPGLAG